MIYDSDGSRYGIGRGLFVFVDGHCLLKSGALARTLIPLPPTISGATKGEVTQIGAREDFAVNPGVPDGPLATASSSVSPAAVEEAIDGRLWFFSSNPNGWSPAPSDKNPRNWYAINFRERRTIGSVELYFFADGEKYKAPSAFRVQFQTPGGWQDIPQQQRAPQQPLANGENAIMFPPLSAQELRIVLTNPPSPGTFRLVEVRAFAP